MNEYQFIEVSSDDFRGKLAKYIDEVRYNKINIVITRRGKPVAKLINFLADEHIKDNK